MGQKYTNISDLYQQVKLNEKSRHFKVIGRSIKYIEIICNYRLQSKEDMDKNQTLQIMRERIKERPLPERNNNEIEPTVINITVNEFDVQETDRGRQVSEILEIGSSRDEKEESINHHLITQILV